MKTMLMLCVLSLAACGPKTKAADTTTKKTDDTTKVDDTAKTTAADTPCATAMTLECPEGQVDGCTKEPAEGANHACVSK